MSAEELATGVLGIALTLGSATALAMAFLGVVRSLWRLKTGTSAAHTEASVSAAWLFLGLFAVPVVLAGLLLSGALLPGPYFGD